MTRLHRACRLKTGKRQTDDKLADRQRVCFDFDCIAMPNDNVRQERTFLIPGNSHTRDCSKDFTVQPVTTDAI